MSATTKVESLTPFTWNECDFTWDSDMSNKSFDELGYLTYSMTGSETIGVEDTPIKKIGKKLKESLNAWDSAPSKNVVARKSEALNILSSIRKNIARAYAEQVKFNEEIKKHASLRKVDAFKLLDKNTKKVLLNKFESIGFTEVYWDVMNFYLKVVENIMLEEVPSKNTGRTISDHFSTKDSITKKASYTFTEGFSLSASLLKTIMLVESEVLKTSDKADKRFNKVPIEPISISDGLAKEATVKISEVAGIVDNLGKYATFCRNFIENMSISDSLSKLQVKQIDEAFTAEDIVISATEKLISESVSVSDAHKLVAVFSRLFSESVNVSEVPKKHFYSMQNEQISMLGRFIRACNAVLSNIELSANEMTVEQFEEMAKKPVGYGVFSDFNVGEYEYQKALVRILVHSNETHSAPLLYGVEHHVDIPDTDDRGTVTITDTTASTKVYYNKHYYTPPEVSITMRGGTEGSGVVIPSIGTTDGKDTLGRYFTVELLNTSGNRVQGTFTWVSKGY